MRYISLLVALAAATILGAMILGSHATSPARASAASDPTAVPASTQTNQPAIRAVLDFYAAYNRRDIPAILALLPRQIRYDDCDFVHHREIYLSTRSAVTRWLRSRFKEHDRFAVLGPLTAGPGPGKAGVQGAVSRSSDSLDPLVARGLIPSDNDGLGKFIVRGNGKIDLVGIGGLGECTVGTLRYGSKPAKERALARAFLDAYARKDVAGVFSVLADNVVYDDCDFAQGTVVSLSGKPAVEAWLRARFAAADRLAQPRILLKSWLSQYPNTPTTLAIEATRSNQALETATLPLTVRVVPNIAVSKIHLWQVWSSCSAPVV